MPVEIKQHDNLHACLILTMANEELWSDQIRGKINRESIAFHSLLRPLRDVLQIRIDESDVTSFHIVS